MKQTLLLKHRFLSYATDPQQVNACWGDFPGKSSPTKRKILDRAGWVHYYRVPSRKELLYCPYKMDKSLSKVLHTPKFCRAKTYAPHVYWLYLVIVYGCMSVYIYPNVYIYIYIWQCVKTNSTPSVHIKIAGIHGCSSHSKWYENSYWSIYTYMSLPFFHPCLRFSMYSPEMSIEFGAQEFP